jgi:hypothetical protein
MTCTSASPGASRLVTGLLLPARHDRAVTVAQLPLTAAALSSAIGGGLLDDAYYGLTVQRHEPTRHLPGAVVAPVGTPLMGHAPFGTAEGAYCLYLDEDRGRRELALNDRALALGARLGWDPRADLVLRGDVLILGVDDHGNDTDVPPGVLTAAVRAGLIEPLAPGRIPGLAVRALAGPRTRAGQ